MPSAYIRQGQGLLDWWGDRSDVGIAADDDIGKLGHDASALVYDYHG